MTREDITSAVATAVAAELAKLAEPQPKVTFDVNGPDNKQIQFTRKRDAASASSKDLYGECDPYEDRPNSKRGLHLARHIRALALRKLNGGEYGLPAWAVAELALAKAAMNETTNSAGGFTVFPEYVADIIPLLEAKSVVRAAGADVVPMNSNVLNQPREASAATATYVAESTSPGVTTFTLEQLSLAAKKLVAIVRMSNDWIRDSAISADGLVRDRLVKALALRQDLAFIRGDGTSNTPTGIRSQTDVTVTSLGTNGATPTYDDFVNAETTLVTNNVNFTSPAWLMHGRQIGSIRKVKDSTGKPIFDRVDAGDTIWGEKGLYRYILLGYPLFVSNQIPIDLTSGTSTDCSEIYFGDFAEAVIGENEELLVDVSMESTVTDAGSKSAFELDETHMRAIQRHDFGLYHPKAFNVLTGVRG